MRVRDGFGGAGVAFHWETKKLIKTAIHRGIYKAVKVKGPSGRARDCPLTHRIRDASRT
jgi:hypothetical protein